MKKKKKYIIKEDETHNSINIKEKFKTFFKKEKVKDFILIFILTFIIATSVTLQQKPLDPQDKIHKAGDCWYYFRNAQLFSKIWEEPFHYIPGLIFNTLNQRELLNIGFNHNSDFDSFFRAPVYITYLSFWISIFGESNLSLLLSQVFLLSLIFSFIYLILREFVNRKWSFSGVILSLFYLSFYLSAIYTMTELFQTLIILILLYYSYRLFNSEKNKKKYYIMLAVLVLTLTLTKATLKFIYILIIPLFLYFEYLKSKDIIKIYKKNISTFIISFFILFLLFNMIASRGKTGQSGLVGGWRNFYGGSCYYSEGLGISTSYHSEEFRKNIDKGKDKFWFTRYSEICKYAIIDLIKNHPLKFISIALKRMKILITYAPVNKNIHNFLLKTRHLYQNYFHFFLVLINVLFLFFIYDKKDKKYFIYKLYFFILLVYYCIFNGYADPRYMLPLSAFYFISLIVLLKKFLDKKIYKNKNFYFIILINIILILSLNKNFILHITNNIDLLQLLQFIIFNGILISNCLIFKKQLKLLKKQDIIFGIILMLFIYLILMPGLFDNRNINHFATDQKNIKQKIIINNFKKEDYKEAFIIIDVDSIKTNEKLNIQLNKFKTNIALNNPGLAFIRNFESDKEIPNEPKWIFIPVSLNLIRNTNIINIPDNNLQLYYGIKNTNRKIPSVFYYMSDMQHFINKYFKKLSDKDFNILLVHSPDYLHHLKKEEYRKIDLILAGHTHGGQVRVPFFGHILTRTKYSHRIADGFKIYNKTYININRGLGQTVNMRFNCRPEAVLIDIKKA